MFKKIINQNFKTKNFKFPHVYYAAQRRRRSSQSICVIINFVKSLCDLLSISLPIFCGKSASPKAYGVQKTK
jgi:hypothetical protein